MVKGLVAQVFFNLVVLVRVKGWRWSRWIMMVNISSETGIKPKDLVLAVTGPPLKIEGCYAT